MVPGFPVGMRRRLEVHDSNPRPPLTPFGYTLYPKGYRPQGPRAGRPLALCRLPHAARARTRPPQTRRAPRPAARRPRLAWRCYRTGQHVFGAAVALPSAGACARWGVAYPWAVCLAPVLEQQGGESMTTAPRPAPTPAAVPAHVSAAEELQLLASGGRPRAPGVRHPLPPLCPVPAASCAAACPTLTCWTTSATTSAGQVSAPVTQITASW